MRNSSLYKYTAQLLIEIYQDIEILTKPLKTDHEIHPEKRDACGT